MPFTGGRTEIPVNLTTEGGWNTSVHPTELADNQLEIAFNVDYEPTTARLQTREGIQISAIARLETPIDFLYSFVRDAEESYIIAASSNQLFKLGASGLRLLTSDHEPLTDSDGNQLVTGRQTDDAWEKIADIETNIPTMITFNGKLVVADGSANGLLSWDGTTLERISGSPAGAINVYTMKNRVICTATGRANFDAVYMSAPENESQWDPQQGALILRAGYGDGLRVNGFSTINETLLVSKFARSGGGVITQKQIHGIDMVGEAANWSARSISNLNAASNAHAIIQIGQDVLYIDSEGFETLRPTEAYGDIATDPSVGALVNSSVSSLARSSSDIKLIHIPSNNEILAIFRSPGIRSRVFHFSKLVRRFTEIEYFVGDSSNNIRAAVEHGEEVFFAGDSGYLYQRVREGRDEPMPNEYTDVTSVVRFKRSEGAGDLLLTRSFMRINFLSSGQYIYEVYGDDVESKRELARFDFSTGEGGIELHDANQELVAATGDLSGKTTEQRDVRSRFRARGIQAQIRTANSGRVSISRITQSIAVVGR